MPPDEKILCCSMLQPSMQWYSRRRSLRLLARICLRWSFERCQDSVEEFRLGG